MPDSNSTAARDDRDLEVIQVQYLDLSSLANCELQVAEFVGGICLAIIDYESGSSRFHWHYVP